MHQDDQRNKEIDMKIKSIMAGLIVAMTMLVVGSSQAAYARCAGCATCPTCATWNVPAQYTGTGWHRVPCGTTLNHATTWQEYSSGRYAPPEARGGLLFGP